MATGGTFTCQYCWATFTWYYRGDGKNKDEEESAARQQRDEHELRCEYRERR